MPSAIFKAGNPLILNYTPDAAKVGGDVIIENDVPIVMHRPYDPDDGVHNQMSGAAFGGGVYELTKATGFTVDWCEAIYWNASTGATKTQGDYSFGRAVGIAGTNDTTVLVYHDPIVGQIEES